MDSNISAAAEVVIKPTVHPGAFTLKLDETRVMDPGVVNRFLHDVHCSWKSAIISTKASPDEPRMMKMDTTSQSQSSQVQSLPAEQ